LLATGYEGIRERQEIVGALNEFHNWTEGKALNFDDTFNHEVWNDTEGYRVVLFVDFARPLRQPWQWLNEQLLNIGVRAPFLREAGKSNPRGKRSFTRTKPARNTCGRN
jgi:ornithine lipid ester-linked acyl 2-hydroxylase